MGALHIQSRWIEEDPERLFEPEEYLDLVPRFEWRLDDPREVASFDPMNARGATLPRRGGWAIRYVHPFIRLSRAVEIEASRVQRIELVLAGARRGHVQLLWAREGERLSPERKIEILASETERLAVFDLSAHPQWSGSITRLVVTPNTAPDQTVVLRSVRGFGHRADPVAPSESVSRPWKVQLGSDTRNALLAPSGRLVERDVEIPPAGVLRIGYGVWPRPLSSTAFRVWLTAGTDERVLRVEKRLDLDSDAGWHETRVDLSSYSGRRVRIALETMAEGDVERSIPVWAHPELLSAGPPPERPNVILVSIDTLRSSRISMAARLDASSSWDWRRLVESRRRASSESDGRGGASSHGSSLGWSRRGWPSVRTVRTDSQGECLIER